MSAPPARHRLRTWIAVPVGLAILLAACGGSDRPALSEWQSQWESLVAAIPAESELGDPPDKDRCAETLGIIREAAPGLRVPPDMAADDAVSAWLTTSESAFFGCPPGSGEITSFSVAYEELERLEREINVALGLESR